MNFEKMLKNEPIDLKVALERTNHMTENEPQIYAELDESKERIESLETAVKDLKLTLNKILEFMEAYTDGKL